MGLQSAWCRRGGPCGRPPLVVVSRSLSILLPAGLDGVIRIAHNRIHEGCGPDRAAAVEPAEANRGLGAPGGPFPVPAGRASDRARNRATGGTEQSGAPAQDPAALRALRRGSGSQARRFPAGARLDLHVPLPPRRQASFNSSLTPTQTASGRNSLGLRDRGAPAHARR